MKLRLERTTFTDKSTIGELYLDNDFLCYTLEDVVRLPGVKVYGETCIPYGRYSVTLSWSNRFKQLMPLVYNKPDLSVQDDKGVRFDGIRIHAGNTAKDTHGCPLVGLSKSKDFVGNSRDAYKLLMDKLKYIDIIKLDIVKV